MDSTNDLNAANDSQPLIGVIKIKIDAIDAPALLAESIDVLRGESKGLQGFLAAQILLSVDSKTMVILTEWSDHHAWSQSRYDDRVGKMMERCNAKSTTIEFEIYTRRVEFGKLPLHEASLAPRDPPDAS